MCQRLQILGFNCGRERWSSKESRRRNCQGIQSFWKFFKNSNLSYKTKRHVYKMFVLGILLYGSETWTTKRFDVRKLEVFHNRCMRTIMGMSLVQQRLSSIQVAK